MKRICIFCGSNSGTLKEYSLAAEACGRLLAKRGLTLVYGGGNVGLMGILADAVLEAGGEVIGVIPRKLIEKEVAHHGISSLIPVDTMHERKFRMAELADAFVALPGGIGTMEELFEAFTWSQLGFHTKPVGLLNTAGFYEPLLAFLRQMEQQRFLKPEHLETLLVHHEFEALLDKLADSKPSGEGKWIDKAPTLPASGLNEFNGTINR
ncbi:MAG TPA: TIGR00730 family Rossman fold protein [Clostridia bacterium]|nr:TIGR00730 family Rossman fold protein [Clostridia bacterium]